MLTIRPASSKVKTAILFDSSRPAAPRRVFGAGVVEREPFVPAPYEPDYDDPVWGPPPVVRGSYLTRVGR